MRAHPDPARDGFARRYTGDGEQPSMQERTVTSLFGDLARHTSLLFRQELALAKAEMAEKGRELGRGAAIVAAGGLIAFAGILALVGAAVAGLSLVVPVWAAALIVGVIVTAIGGILAYVGRSSLAPGNLVPHRTIRTLKEDSEWAKDQVR